MMLKPPNIDRIIEFACMKHLNVVKSLTKLSKYAHRE